MSTFYKLVSNIPFHPSVLGEISFYSRRLLREEKIRRIGFALMTILLIMQIFGIIVPPKPSLATSTNDIIYGASSKDQVLKAYSQNRDNLGRKDIRNIYDHYGIGLDQIVAATSTKIGSRQRDFISTGRATSPGIDTFIPIQGVNDGGIYQRSLNSWDTNGRQNWYNAITGQSKFGFRFWIITDGCGNIVFEREALSPNLEISKKIESDLVAAGGDTVGYTIQFRNVGPGIAKNVHINDDLVSSFKYESYTSDINLNLKKSGSKLSWTIANGKDLSPSNRWHVIKLKLRANNVSKESQACNTAIVDASNAKQKLSENPNKQKCIKIIPPTCPNSGLPIPPEGIDHCTYTCPDGTIVAYNKECKTPVLYCQSLKIIETPSWSKRKFLTTTRSQQGASPLFATYYINDKPAANVNFLAGQSIQTFTYDFAKEGDYKVRVDITSKTGSVQPNGSCTLNITISKPASPEPMISTDKTVSNLTQNIQNADGTTAKPGDKLKYTIHIYNKGDAPAINLELNGEYSESINDILEYSDLSDKGDALYNDQTRSLSWGPVNIPAGSQISKSFMVQVKDPLPATPTSASDPLSYDYKMQNFYGNLVVINLEKPASKIVEQGATVLPNTGPGTGMIAMFCLFTIVGYFYYRNYLLRKELNIIQDEYSSGSI